MVSNDDSEGTRVGEQKWQAPVFRVLAWAFQCAIARVHPMTFGNDMAKKPPQKWHLRQKFQLHHTMILRHRNPLTSFIFIPSRDLRSLRGASLDHFSVLASCEFGKNTKWPISPYIRDFFPSDFFKVSPTACALLRAYSSLI